MLFRSLYIKFSEVNDRNSAENLRNKKLYLEKEMLEENLQDDEILVDDLIGMLLFDTDGEKVGQIVDVENYGATFNLIIEKNGRTVQTPFVDGLLIKDGDTFKVNRKIFEEVSV